MAKSNKDKAGNKPEAKVNDAEMLPVTFEQLVELSQEELAQMVLDEKAKSAEAEEAFLSMISELKSQVSSKKQEVSAEPVVVSIGNKSFSIAHPSFRYKGKIYKASEIDQYPDIVSQIMSDEDQTLFVEVEN